MDLGPPNNSERSFSADSPGLFTESADPSEQELWRQFTEATSTRAFCEGWLSLQCNMIPGVQCALLVLGVPDRGPFRHAAVWPGGCVSVTHLIAVAEQSLKGRRGVIVKSGQNGDPEKSVRNSFHVAYPVEVSGKIHGVVVLDAAVRPDEDISLVAKQLHWGAAWLEVMLRRTQEVTAGRENERLRKVLDSIAITLEHEGFKQASMAFVTGLATMLECDRVSLGFMKGERIVVRALSHSAEFREGVNLMRAIANAMEEAIDQRATVTYPLPADSLPLITREHESLARQYGMGGICTVPFGVEGRFFGALTLELPANKTLDEEDIELVKTVASLGGPILDAKRKEDRWLAAKAGDVIGKKVRNLIGPSHPTLKVIGTLILLLMVLFTFVKDDYRVKARTILEGSIQRSISAPIAGYVVTAPKRAGDIVLKGEMLCSLDDRDLRLEHLKWSTQREQFEKEYRGAVAKHDRVQVSVIGAKIDQAEAQIALLDEQLSRTRIVAPFNGVVTSGDLSQSLGAPVERGQVLFELAPPDSYRVILQIDERDISEIKVGQEGDLVLPSLPGEVFPLRISMITPVSTAEEGRNFFRVEAQLNKGSNRLRPGMEGVGKVEIGRRKLIWIWTHEAVNWVRLKLWSWLP